jgi:hypothetical protein
LSTSVEANVASEVILAVNSLVILAFSTSDNNFHVFDGVTDRTLESYAQRLTINIIDALNSTSATAALSAKQGSILKGLVDSKANATGDNSIAFNALLNLLH